MGSTIGKLKHYIRIGWTFVFNFTVPVILKDKINPPRLVASLLLSPVVLWFAKGSKYHRIQFLTLSNLILEVFLMLFGSAYQAQFC